MIDNDSYYKDLEHFGYAGSSLRNIDRIRELRILSKSTRRRLAEIETGRNNEKEIAKEKILLDAIQRELSRLERRAIFSEMGFQSL